MPRPTLTRQTELNVAARRLVDGYGIANLDSIQDEETRAKALRALYRQFRTEMHVRPETARVKIAWACRRARAEMTKDGAR